MRYRVQLPWSKIKGDFNLELTIQSDQRSIMIWRKSRTGYYRLIKFQGIPIKLGFELTDLGLSLRFETESKLAPAQISKLSQLCVRMFSLDLDLDRFYSTAAADPVMAELTRAYRGLRLMIDPDPNECLISFICTQNTNLQLWNRMLDLLQRKLGEQVEIEGNRYRLFPEPSKIAQASLELLQECKLGYRAPYVKQVAQLICSGLDLESLNQLPFHQIRSKLMELPGVGPKVADCTLLYGYGFTQVFPVDRRVRKLVSKLYFRDRNLLDRQIRQFFQSRYASLAGLANIYLFSYFSLHRKFGLGPDWDP